MKCKNCGRFFKTTGRGRAPMYCSEKCRVDAHRKKNPKPTKPSRQEVLFEIPGESKPIKTTISTDELTKDVFDRMCDSRTIDELRFAKDIIHNAMISPDTPPSALAALSKTLIEISEKIECLGDSDNPLIALETEDVTNDTFDAATI